MSQRRRRRVLLLSPLFGLALAAGLAIRWPGAKRRYPLPELGGYWTATPKPPRIAVRPTSPVIWHGWKPRWTSSVAPTARPAPSPAICAPRPSGG